MQLLADLKLFPAADAMQWAAAARLDGTLVFQRNHRTLRILLDKGRIVRCESNREHESFRQHLYSQGWVDRLDLAAAEQMTEPSDLGSRLVELGILTERQARELFTAHTLDLACSVVAWPDGVVHAKEASLRALDLPQAQPLDTVFATMEAARRVDELTRLSHHIAHENVSLTAAAGPSTKAPRPPAQQRLLESFDGSQTIDELYQVVGGCRYNFMRNLEELIDDGVLALGEAGPAPERSTENRLALLDVLLDNQPDRRQLA